MKTQNAVRRTAAVNGPVRRRRHRSPEVAPMAGSEEGEFMLQSAGEELPLFSVQVKPATGSPLFRSFDQLEFVALGGSEKSKDRAATGLGRAVAQGIAF